MLSQAWSGASGAEVRLFTGNAMATEIVEQLGLRNAWDDGFQQYGFSTVSVEALPKLGDAHFFYVVQDEDNVFDADAVRPLWESLPFVKAGRAHALGGDTWLFGGPLSAELLANTVAGELTKYACCAPARPRSPLQWASFLQPGALAPGAPGYYLRAAASSASKARWPRKPG